MIDYSTPIDIRYIVSLLAPGAEFHWKGPEFGTYADIGDWRSPDIPKPTEVEVYARWGVYQQELAQQKIADKLRESTREELRKLDIPAVLQAIDTDIAALQKTPSVEQQSSILVNLLKRQQILFRALSVTLD